MKYSILTYIFNDYEDVHEIINKDPDVEYLLITDNPNLHSDTWTVICDKDLLELSPFDKCYRVRYNCFKYCSTDICIRIDGSMQVTGSLDYLVEEFNGGDYDLALMVHPWRDNLLEEYKIWCETRSYPYDRANLILNMLTQANYDVQNTKGLFQAGVSISRRGKVTDDIDRITYSLLKYYGTEEEVERLDQTLLSYVINFYFNDLKVLPLSQRVIDSPELRIYAHKSDKRYTWNFDRVRYADEGYVFNRKVKLFWNK